MEIVDTTYEDRRLSDETYECIRYERVPFRQRNILIRELFAKLENVNELYKLLKKNNVHVMHALIRVEDEILRDFSEDVDRI